MRILIQLLVKIHLWVLLLLAKFQPSSTMLQLSNLLHIRKEKVLLVIPMKVQSKLVETTIEMTILNQKELKIKILKVK